MYIHIYVHMCTHGPTARQTNTLRSRKFVFLVLLLLGVNKGSPPTHQCRVQTEDGRNFASCTSINPCTSRKMPAHAIKCKTKVPPLPPPESMLGKVARCMRTCEIYSGETPPCGRYDESLQRNIDSGGCSGAAHTIWIRKLHDIYLTCEKSSVNSHP